MLLCSVCRIYQSLDIWAVICAGAWPLWCVRAVVCVWSVAPMMLLCSVCSIYQGFDIWAVVCAGMWPLWCYSVLFVGYIKGLISELWFVFGVWPLWCYSVLFVGYIKALISELWSVLECGPHDVTLFCCRIYQIFDIRAVVCVGVWPLWCYSVLFVGYIKALISELWSVLECGSYHVKLFCLQYISKLWYQSCGLFWSVAPLMLLCSIAGYIKALISELWSVLECGPYDVTLFCCRIYQSFDIRAVVCVGVWPLWCYSV